MTHLETYLARLEAENRGLDANVKEARDRGEIDEMMRISVLQARIADAIRSFHDNGQSH